jgi:hypothetical protein
VKQQFAYFPIKIVRKINNCQRHHKQKVVNNICSPLGKVEALVFLDNGLTTTLIDVDDYFEWSYVMHDDTVLMQNTKVITRTTTEYTLN